MRKRGKRMMGNKAIHIKGGHYVPNIVKGKLSFYVTLLLLFTTFFASFAVVNQPTVAYATTTTHTVTFNSNGGSAVSSQTVNDNGTATQPADPTKAGYTLGGWYTDSDLTTAFDFAALITADTTLYAKWQSINPIWTFAGPQSFSGTPVTEGTSVGSASEMTVAFSMTANTLGFQIPIDKSPSLGSGTTAGWTVKLRNQGDIWFVIGPQTSSGAYIVVPSAYSANTPVHVALSFGNGTAKVYINGVLHTTTLNNVPQTIQTGITQTVNNTQTELALGGATEIGQNETFDGSLQNVRIYDRVLSDTEVAALVSPSTHVVTYSGNGATIGSVPNDSGSYAPGNTSTVYGNTGNLVKPGYTFAGWNTQADGKGTDYAQAIRSVWARPM